MPGLSGPILPEEELIELAFFRDLEAGQLIEHGFMSRDSALTSPLEGEFILEYE
jgi:hypothetical protein